MINEATCAQHLGIYYTPMSASSFFSLCYSSSKKCLLSYGVCMSVNWQLEEYNQNLVLYVFFQSSLFTGAPIIMLLIFP